MKSMLIGLVPIAFEGRAHPYKENLIKFHGGPQITEQPVIKEAFQEAKSS
jgi:hypothetical protein